MRYDDLRSRDQRVGKRVDVNPRTCALLVGQGGHDRRCDTLGDEANRSRAALHLEVRLECNAAGTEGSVEDGTIAAHLAGEDERVGGQLSPREAPAPGERMIVAADQREPILQYWYARQLRLMRSADVNSELSFSANHGLSHAGR